MLERADEERSLDLRNTVMTLACLSLGSNLGDREKSVAEMIRLLSVAPGVKLVRTSKLYETEPVGLTDQPRFMNAAVTLETEFGPFDLLEICKGIEARLGRKEEVRWGPRVADIDIVLFGSLVMETPFLTIPHPEMHLREFVLEPLCEIAPEAIHPIFGKKVKELLAGLNEGPFDGRIQYSACFKIPHGDCSREAKGSRMEEAISKALYDAGVTVAACVPGSGMAGIYESYCKMSGRAPVYSFNEEAAYGMVYGSALAGARSAIIYKAQGAAKAANAIADSLTAGVTAGLVTITVDDIECRHSEGIFDIVPFLRGMGMPFILARPENVYQCVVDCFKQSELTGLPFALLVESGELACESGAGSVEMPPIPRYSRDIARHLLSPVAAGYQNKVLKARQAGKEWRGIAKPPAPIIPDSVPEIYRKMMKPFEGFFDVFRSIRVPGDMVCGDTSACCLYAFSPYDCIDTSVYYGCSSSIAAGAILAGLKNVWAITGDYSFVAAGHLGLIEAVAREIPLKLVIFHNDKAVTTGGQPIPVGIFERCIAPFGDMITRISANASAESMKKVLKDMADSKVMRIMIVEM